MRILIACEYSGVERDAFRALGHDAVSCDLLPSDKPGPHIKGDVLEHLRDGWDMMIAHPPCTYLANSNAGHGAHGCKKFTKEEFKALQADAICFALKLFNAPIPRIAIENPMSALGTHVRTYDQCIQPWMFGHGEMKTTWLWLKNLPPLVPTRIVKGREQRVWFCAPCEDRWKNRAKSFPGIAKAMAEQWGSIRRDEHFDPFTKIPCPLNKQGQKGIDLYLKRVREALQK